MATNISLTNIATFTNDSTAVAATTANNSAITTAFQDVLSRSGTSPNTMSANLDMNSNRILNLPQPTNPTDPVRLTDLGTTIGVQNGSGPATTNTLAYWSGTNSISSDPAFIVDPINNRLGIGNITPDSPITLNTNTAATITPNPGCALHIVGPDTTNANIVMDAFGIQPSMYLRVSGGTNASKTPIQVGNLIFAQNAQGWDGSGAYVTGANIQYAAAENWVSGTNRGTTINFRCCPVGAAGTNEGFRITGTGPIILAGATIPTGGSTGNGLGFSNTPNFGIYFGVGAPSLSAAQGSLYIRSDGNSTSTRLYVNTNGSTTWTNVTTAA